MAENKTTTTNVENNTKNDNILEVKHLKKYFPIGSSLGKAKGYVKAVDDVSFSIKRGTTMGLVGESGCGKSVTSLSMLQLVQRPTGQTVEGEIRFNAGDKVYNVVNAPATEYQIHTS